MEDNEFSGRMLVRILEESGHTVRHACDGESALRAVIDEAPDVVVLDIALPDMDGYEVAQRIRAVPGLQDLVLIALTGYGREEDRERAFAAGFNHHLVKPVDFEALLSVIGGQSGSGSG